MTVDRTTVEAARDALSRAVGVQPGERDAGRLARLTGIDPAPPERLDVLLRRSRERDVEMPRHRVLVAGPSDREVAPLVEARPRIARLAEHGRVEAARRLAVGDPDHDVVEHGWRMSIASPKE